MLPFENVGEEANAYFADGIQDDILIHLSKIRDLKVISRNSVEFFRARPRNLPEIGKALGVATVLEGNVLSVGSRVRVQVQLIDIVTGTQIWGESYDRLAKDILGVQSEIAQNVANQLQLTLSKKEQAALKEKATADPLAYELYLKARRIDRTATDGTFERYRQQQTLLEQAVARDPGFVSALCLLARTHLRFYWFNADRSAVRLDSAKRALEAAARLSRMEAKCTLPAEFIITGAPGMIARPWPSWLLRGARCQTTAKYCSLLEKSNSGRGAGMNPRGTWERHSPLIRVMKPCFGKFLPLTELRGVSPMRRAFATTSSLGSPMTLLSKFWRAWVDVGAEGDVRRLASVLFGESAKKEDAAWVAELRVYLAFLQRDYSAAEKALAACPYEELDQYPRETYEALIARGFGDTNKAQTAFHAAYERAAAKVAKQPDDAVALMMLAETAARLDRKEDAIRHGERAVELLPVSKDAQDGPRMLGRLTHVYAQVGETGRALDLIEKLAGMPGGVAYGWLILDEKWDALRGDPRFEKIVASLAPKDNGGAAEKHCRAAVRESERR